MEQVLFRLHVRCITTTCNIIQPRARIFCEKLIFLIAILSLCVTTLLHFSYVSPLAGNSNCLINAVSRNRKNENNHNNTQFLFKTEYAEIVNIRITTDNFLSNSLIYDSKNVSDFISKAIFILGNMHTFNFSFPFKIDNYLFGETVLHQRNETYSNKYEQAKYDSVITIRTYKFSLEKGYLLLPQHALTLHNITQSNISIMSDSACFGHPLSSLLLRALIGYDTVTKNWVIRGFGGRGYLYNTQAQDMYDLNLAADFVARTGNAGGTGLTRTSGGSQSSGGGRGVVDGNNDSFGKKSAVSSRNAVNFGKTDGDNNKAENFCHDTTCDVVDARTVAIPNNNNDDDDDAKSKTATEGGWQHYIAFKVGVLITTLFLFFTTTTLVSFTLRVTQERMLKFTFLLNYNISNRIPIAAIVITHVVETLVFVPLMIGLLFFLIEFFLDQFLAFLVLSLVWLAEVFSLVSLRSQTSLRHFPTVFFCYFCLFHIYFFCFPFGFAYPALLTTVLFLSHAMICFWNYCEIPAFEAGLITALHPRFGAEEQHHTDMSTYEVNSQAIMQQQMRQQQYPRSQSESGAYNNNSNNNHRQYDMSASPNRLPAESTFRLHRSVSPSSSSSSSLSQRRQFLSHHSSPTHAAGYTQQQPQPFQSRFHFNSSSSSSSSMGSSQHSENSDNTARNRGTRPSSLSQPLPLTLPFPLTPIRRPSFHRPSMRRVSGAPPPQPLPLSPDSHNAHIHTTSQQQPSEPVLSPGISQREMTYSRHVELSRRIQDQQMAAMLLVMNNTNGAGSSSMLNTSGSSVLPTSLLSSPLPSIEPLIMRAPPVHSRTSTSSSAADVGLDLDDNEDLLFMMPYSRDSYTHSRSGTMTSDHGGGAGGMSPARSPARPSLRRSLSSLTTAMRALERDGSSADLQSQSLLYM